MGRLRLWSATDPGLLQLVHVIDGSLVLLFGLRERFQSLSYGLVGVHDPLLRLFDGIHDD